MFGLETAAGGFCTVDGRRSVWAGRVERNSRVDGCPSRRQVLWREGGNKTQQLRVVQDTRRVNLPSIFVLREIVSDDKTRMIAAEPFGPTSKRVSRNLLDQHEGF
jgi:hypothetical protein